MDLSHVSPILGLMGALKGVAASYKSATVHLERALNIPDTILEIAPVN